MLLSANRGSEAYRRLRIFRADISSAKMHALRPVPSSSNPERRLSSFDPNPHFSDNALQSAGNNGFHVAKCMQEWSSRRHHWHQHRCHVRQHQQHRTASAEPQAIMHGPPASVLHDSSSSQPSSHSAYQASSTCLNPGFAGDSGRGTLRPNRLQAASLAEESWDFR